MKRLLLSVIIVALLFSFVPLEPVEAAETYYDVWADYGVSDDMYQYVIEESWEAKTDTETYLLLYSGKTMKPKVHVFSGTVGSEPKELSSSNYTVTYGNLKDVGTHKITVKGKGKHSKLNKTIKVKIVKSWQTKLKRIYGNSRYETSTTIAKNMLNEFYGKGAKYNDIFVTSGERFPDGLSGGTIARMHGAPILNWSKGKNKQVQDFIKANVRKGGTVYVLGGPVAVGNEISKNMGNYKFVRIKGNDRFGTNEAILKHYEDYAKKSYWDGYLEYGQCVLVDWNNWECAMIASGTGSPIILVGPNGLTKKQKDFVKTKKKWQFVLFGNEATLNKANSYLKSLKLDDYQITRIKGNNADELSVNFAKYNYWYPKDFYLAKAGIGKTKPTDFADGLCTGPYARGPILLVSKSNPKIEAYMKKLKVINSVTVLGGPLAVSDANVRKIAKNSNAKFTTVINLIK